jgi:hypothetical protein
MKPGYGLGVLVVVLLTAAVALLGLLGPQGAVSMGLLLAGLWTIAAAFFLVAAKERSYYAGWGIIITGLSFTYYIPVQDAVGLILIAIVALIVVTAYFARAPRVVPEAANGSSGGTSAPTAT